MPFALPPVTAQVTLWLVEPFTVRRGATLFRSKAYVEKQRRQPTKIAGSGNGNAEIGAVWTDSGGTNKDGTNKNEDHLRAGRFFLEVSRKRAPLAVAAPGLH